MAADKVSLPMDHSKMKQVEHDGVTFMECNEQVADHVPKVRAMTLREDDVILATFPKSGTHWMYRVLDMVMRGSAEYYPRNPDSVFLDAQKVEDLDTLASTRVIGTHYPFPYLPEQVKCGRTKVVHVYRDPRAVLMSAYFMMKATKAEATLMPDLSLEQFLNMFLSPKMICTGWFGWMDRVASYEKDNPDVPIFHVSYEEMSKDPDGTVARLVTFLGRDVSDTLRAEIVAACSFNRQKKAEEGMDNSQAKTAFYRKGDMNDWKNHLTVAMSETITRILKERPDCRFSAQYV